MKLTEARVRAQVQRALRQTITDEQWAHFRDATMWVDMVLEGEQDIPWLVEKVRQALVDVFGSALTSPTQSPTKSERSLRQTRSPSAPFWGLTRQEALCVAVAALAERDVEVRAFRREVLGERLPTYALDSSREDVGEWIERQLGREQPQLAAFAGDPPQLTYIKFIGEGVETTPVAPGGVLDRLRQLAERLAVQYHWQPAAAAAFVLTDTMPNVATFRVTVRPNHQVTTLSRMVIEVDIARTPEEVAEAYRQVRNRLLRSRTRAMSEKHLGLGAFAATRPPREPLAQQMAAWNAQVPDPTWSYKNKQPTNFARDRAKAFARLVQPDYQLPAQEETTSYDDFTLQRDTDADDTSNDENDDA